MDKQTCIDCKTTHPQTEEFFYRKKRGANRPGYQWNKRCKACFRIMMKTRYNEREMQLRARSKVSGRAREMWHTARTRAQHRKMNFDLTREWVEQRLRAGRCEASGIALELDVVGRRNAHPFAPSIDRRDSSLGYTQSNCQVVVFIHNQAVGRWGTAALHKYMKGYLKNRVK